MPRHVKHLRQMVRGAPEHMRATHAFTVCNVPKTSLLQPPKTRPPPPPLISVRTQPLSRLPFASPFGRSYGSCEFYCGSEVSDGPSQLHADRSGLRMQGWLPRNVRLTAQQAQFQPSPPSTYVHLEFPRGSRPVIAAINNTGVEERKGWNAANAQLQELKGKSDGMSSVPLQHNRTDSCGGNGGSTQQEQEEEVEEEGLTGGCTTNTR